MLVQGLHPFREPGPHRRGGEQEAEEAEGGHEQGRRQEIENVGLLTCECRNGPQLRSKKLSMVESDAPLPLLRCAHL